MKEQVLAVQRMQDYIGKNKPERLCIIKRGLHA